MSYPQRPPERRIVIARTPLAKRRITRKRVATAVGIAAVVAFLAGMVTLLVPLFAPAPNVISFQPQHITFSVEGIVDENDGDEPLAVHAGYSGRGHMESVWVYLTYGSADDVTVYFAQGGLAQDGWACSAYYGTSGPMEIDPAPFMPLNDTETEKVEAITTEASEYPLRWNVEEPEWLSSANIRADEGITGITCDREGDLWPFVSSTYRAFIPPVVTVAVEPQQDYTFTSERDLWFAGEAAATPGITHFGSDEIDPVTDGLKQQPVRWRDQPLAIHDTTAQQQQDAYLFFLAAIIGALVPQIPRALGAIDTEIYRKRVDKVRARLRMKRFLRRRSRSRSKR